MLLGGESQRTGYRGIGREFATFALVLHRNTSGGEVGCCCFASQRRGYKRGGGGGWATCPLVLHCVATLVSQLRRSLLTPKPV